MTKHVDIGRATRVKAEAPDPENPPQDTHDAYPAIIQDQRHGYGCETLAAIEEYQRGWLAGEVPPHIEPPPRWIPVEPHADPSGREVVPYINASRWIAECPECGAANWVWDHNPRMVCLGRGCGLTFKVLWQNPFDRSEVIRYLALWPAPNRSWDAHKGETLDELKLQGVLMLGLPHDKRDAELQRNGLVIPDNIMSAQEYLDRLRADRIKARL
jgi:hypothetical protein